MPFYPPLRIRPRDSAKERAWKKSTAQKILDLRAALRDHIFAYRTSDQVPTHERDDQKWLRVATCSVLRPMTRWPSSSPPLSND